MVIVAGGIVGAREIKLGRGTLTLTLTRCQNFILHAPTIKVMKISFLQECENRT